MIEKRKKFKKNQIILKLIFLKFELKQKIKKSLHKNHFNNYLFRLSFTVNWLFFKNQYFRTFQKLVCPFSLSKRVPNKNFSYSRFFLNKKLNSFNINNVF
jgi:hypothetical protein